VEIEKQSRNIRRGRTAAMSTLSLAIAATLGLSGMMIASPSHAQATTGSIFGQVPAGNGETILVQSSSGLSRQATPDADGRYTVGSLPLGSYTVTFQRDGHAVDSRSDVTLRVGAGTEVSFTPSADASNAQSLSAVTVVSNTMPAIDVTGVDSRTVITAEQLKHLPVARSAEDIALLAPGVIEGSSLFSGMSATSGSVLQRTGGNVVSLGGSSVTENAYYINGFNTTNSVNGFGGMTLPYGSIDQQEVLSGGYGAAYGRSDGGVISQVGKRGTNEWHFGGQVTWTPVGTQSDPRNYYYVSGDLAGTRYQQRKNNKSSETTVDAYVGGPLIKDKLFFFASVEGDRQQGKETGPTTLPYVTRYSISSPKWYGKLDWNINDSNVLELTGASNKSSYGGNLYDYDYATLTKGGFNSHDTATKVGQELHSVKFTSYITDDITLSVLYGKMNGTYFNDTPGYDPDTPFVSHPERQNPATNGGVPINGTQPIYQLNDPAHTSKNTNLRIDISDRIGSHTITAGLDNQNVRDIHDGQVTSGPGYRWYYYHDDPAQFIAGGPEANGADWQSKPYVYNPGSNAAGQAGYYTSKYIYDNDASVRVKQHAVYVEDSWQVDDRWLLKIGLRDDQFTNYNGDGDPYVRLTKPQWAPRVGFSWDVNGDSTFKVYGNAGRYYLALPASVALREAGASIFTNEYFTYTGVGSDGMPTGLTPIKSSTNGPFSTNGEYGQSVNPKVVASTNLKSEYQDEYILGFDHALGSSWTYGMKATYRNLRQGIDDWGDTGRIVTKMNAMGIDPGTYSTDDILGSYLINPGSSATFRVPKIGGGFYEVPMSWKKDMGFTTDMKRRYYGLEMYLEHAFDGKWYGKLDYLYSRSYGNSEGQVKTDVGQADISATSDWDYAQVMEYANGDLANDHRHQIKAYGSYQIAPEWMVSANVAILSGAPKSCLGYYGADESNPSLAYGSYYHYCAGQPFVPGSKREPWTYLLSLSAEYRPEWADKKLGFNATVYNVLDQQRTTQSYAQYGSSAAVISDYNRIYSTQTPRYVRFGITYDF
jgi:outer membrane receptor for ferrienterochelin and colicin